MTKINHCAFCGKSEQEVERLISGQDANICNECIELCGELLVGADDSTDNQDVDDWVNAKLPSPKKSVNILTAMSLVKTLPKRPWQWRYIIITNA